MLAKYVISPQGYNEDEELLTTSLTAKRGDMLDLSHHLLQPKSSIFQPQEPSAFAHQYLSDLRPLLSHHYLELDSDFTISTFGFTSCQINFTEGTV